MEEPSVEHELKSWSEDLLSIAEKEKKRIKKVYLLPPTLSVDKTSSVFSFGLVVME